MMPQTVPNRPTKGAVAPIVARIPVPREIFRPAAISIRSDCQAMRSFKPSARKLAESRISSAAACMSCATGPLLLRSFHAPARASSHSASARSPRRTVARAQKARYFLRPRPSRLRAKHHKANHNRLHDGIGMQEHAPGGEVLRQRPAATELSPACANAQLGNPAQSKTAAIARRATMRTRLLNGITRARWHIVATASTTSTAIPAKTARRRGSCLSHIILLSPLRIASIITRRRICS